MFSSEQKLHNNFSLNGAKAVVSPRGVVLFAPFLRTPFRERLWREPTDRAKPSHKTAQLKKMLHIYSAIAS